MSKSRNTAPESVRRVQERRMSNAATKHDPMPRKLRTRKDQRNRAVNLSAQES